MLCAVRTFVSQVYETGQPRRRCEERRSVSGVRWRARLRSFRRRLFRSAVQPSYDTLAVYGRALLLDDQRWEVYIPAQKTKSTRK